MARPRREVTLKRRSYALQDDEEEEEEEQVSDKTEASTPRSEEVHNPVPLALPPQMHKMDVQAAVENCVWAEVRNEHSQGMHSDMQYRSDAEDDADHLMLGGIYGHMSQFTSESNASMDLCGGAEEMLLDDGMCTAELDEARWLRRTYETVYNPSARQLALQALTGEADVPAPAPAQPPTADSWLMVKQQQPTGPIRPSDSDSEMQYMVPQQPKMAWNSNPSATRKCTVLYDFV